MKPISFKQNFVYHGLVVVIGSALGVLGDTPDRRGAWFAALLAGYYLQEFIFSYYWLPREEATFLFAWEERHLLVVLISIGEYLLVGRAKGNHKLLVGGVVLAVGGGLLRTVGQWTLKNSFSYSNSVALDRNGNENTSHIGVKKEGVYKVFRHPCYTGWFYWNIGMQLILHNVVSTLVAIGLGVIFFSRRIPYLT